MVGKSLQDHRVQLSNQREAVAHRQQEGANIMLQITSYPTFPPSLRKKKDFQRNMQKQLGNTLM